MPIRVGFICGKDTDLVEDAKYDAIGDSSFLKDMPDTFRVDPESHEYLKDCEPGTKGQAHADVAIAWYIKKHNEDIEVDIITPDEISLKRLKSNDINFTMGYNAVNIAVENNASGPKKLIAFKKCGNIAPTWEVEDYILYKSKYMKACMDAGIPMAPTIFSLKGKRTPAKLFEEIKSRGWKTFVMKMSESGFSLGFCKLKVEDCEKDPSILKNYFKDYGHSPEFIVQEAVEGFTRNWETRCFWFNGEFQYAIANMAAVSTADGAERIVTGDDIPAEFLENAKRIGQEAIKVLPQLKTPTGQPVPMILMRTDIGCSDSEMHDVNTKWDPNVKTFFLNEIEPSSTTYFVRHLKFDSIPMYGKLYADKAREMYSEMQKGPVKVSRKSVVPRKSVAMTAMKAVMKAKPAMKAAMKVAMKAMPLKGKTMKKASAKAVMKVMKAASMKVAVMKAMKAVKGAMKKAAKGKRR